MKGSETNDMRMTRIQRLSAILNGVIVMVLSMTLVSVAHANEVGYTIKLADNAYQKEDKRNVGYFDLVVPPGQATDLQIEIVNTSDDSSTFSVNVTNATTNGNLMLDYTPTKVRSKALKIGVTDLLKADQSEVALAPKTSQTVTLHLTTPKEAIKGTLLGGIHVIKVLTDEEKRQGFASQAAYVKPVKIVSTTSPATPELKFSFDACEIKMINFAQRVDATVTNQAPVYLNDVKMASQITKKGQKKALLSRNIENGKLAPSSTFDLLIDFDKKVLTPGKYTYHITFTSGEKNWQISKDFEVKAVDTSFVINGSSVSKSKLWRYFLLVIVVIAALLFFLIRRKCRKALPVVPASHDQKTVPDATTAPDQTSDISD
jgi:hypothetical protein